MPPSYAGDRDIAPREPFDQSAGRLSDDLPIFGPGLIARTIRVAREDVAWVRYLLEAEDGLANLYSSGDGAVTLIAPAGREKQLDAFIADLDI
jgi:hypothetical protein